MGSRPSIAEYIAGYEAANNAPHGVILLVAGAAYALEALGDVLSGQGTAADGRSSGRPPHGDLPVRHGRRIHRRASTSRGS